MKHNDTSGDRNAAGKTNSSSFPIRPAVLIGGRPILFVDSRTASKEIIGDPVEIAWISAIDGVIHRRLIAPRDCAAISASASDGLNALGSTCPANAVAQELSGLVADHIVVATAAGVERLRLRRLLQKLAKPPKVQALGVIDVATAIGAAGKIDSYILSERIAPAWGRALLNAPPALVVSRTAKLVEVTLDLDVALGSDLSGGFRLVLPHQS